MMKIRIYQINPERDTDRVRFQPLEKINGVVDRNIYDLVFEGISYCKTLEGVKEIMNHQCPDYYSGSEVGTSDVVEVIESDGAEPSFYFCNGKEFKKILFHPIEFEEMETAPEKISVSRIRVGEAPERIEIDNCLDALLFCWLMCRKAENFCRVCRKNWLGSMPGASNIRNVLRGRMKKSKSFPKRKQRRNTKDNKKNGLEGEACTILASSSFLLRSRKNENSLGDTPNTPVRKRGESNE